MAKDVSGVICAMITPREEDGSLSRDGLGKLVDHLVGSGVDVMFPTGSAGEGPLLSAEEKIEVISAVVEAVDGRAAVTPGITCTTTRETIKAGRACDELGVEAVVVVTPWYYKVEDSTLLEYYRDLTEAIETPIIAYKIPQAAVNDISLGLLDSLSELDGIMAVKDSSGDMVWLSYAIAMHGDRLKFFGGNDRLILPCLSAGASGHVSGSSNCFTREVVDVWRHFSAGDIASARKAQQLLLRKVLLLPAGKENSAIREVLRIQGMELGEPLPPMGIISAAERERIRSGLESFEA
jgi:4-hydroxy-tetrahydrodipicolinate synthase